MGGSGSGNFYRFDSKTLTEHCIDIDVRQLNREGRLAPGQRYSWKWTDGNNIMIETKSGAIELDYKISYDGENKKINYEVPLTWTSCNYGGKRPWFICPGKGCGRRVAKLFSRHGYFLCRHCHDLGYLSQREGKESRLLYRAQRIYRRLGVHDRDDLYSTPKPKGMHQTTYDKLCELAKELDHESLLIVARKYGFMSS